MEHLRIGIDCREMGELDSGEPTGIPYYIYYLIQAFVSLSEHERSGVVFVLFFGSDQFVPHEFSDSSCVEIRRFPESVRLLFWGSHWIAARTFRKADLDLLHAPANVIPLFFRDRSVVTVHDLLIYEHPEWFPSGQGLSTRVVVPSSIRRASRLIVPSDAALESVRHCFGLESASVNVVAHGVSTSPSDEEVDEAWSDLLDSHSGLDNDYLLFVGTLEPRKNIQRLVDVYTELVRSRPDLRLVLAGRIGWGIDCLVDSLPDGVLQLGYVSNEEKTALLRHAKAFVYPSLGEGFGLPLLEALREGTPVVTSDVSPLKDVVGDVGWVCDPESEKDMLEKIRIVLDGGELITKRVHGGREWASAFSWERTARETLQVYRDVVNS